MIFIKHFLPRIILITICFLLACPPLFSIGSKIPTNDILEIWEHSCIKHLREGNISRAQQVLKVMNWQCDNKEYLNLDGAESFELAQKTLKEARRARDESVKVGKEWVCYKSQFRSQTKGSFIEMIGERTMDILGTIGANDVVARAIVAQIALETSWGKRVFGNNLFNVKGKYNDQSITFTTHEQSADGSWKTISDAFRKYPTIEDSIKDYLQVLKIKWPDSYGALFSRDKNPVEKFLSGLRTGETGGYATDKLYIQKMRSVHEQIENLLSGQSFSPTYLKCLGREEEYQRIQRSNP